jgi:ligand-binding sensor domain-containing protein
MHWFVRPFLSYPIVGILLACWPLITQARVELLDDRNGLTSNIVHDIIKDKSGFMWMATSNGLNVYDGYTFIRFRELGSQQVRRLMYDNKTDVIWVAVEGGLYVLPGASRKPVPVMADGKPMAAQVRSIVQTNAGEVYVLLGNGDVLSVDDSFRATVFIHAKDHLPKKRESDLFNLTVFSDSVLLFVNHDGYGLQPLYQLHTGTRRIRPIPWRDKKPMLPLSVRKYGDTLVVVLPQKGVVLMNAHTGTPYSIPALERMNDSGTPDLGALCGGMLYTGFKNGRLYQVDLEKGLVEDLAGNIPSFSGTYNQHHCIFRDEQGIVWIGTNRGIFKIVNEIPLFRYLLMDGAPLSIRGMTEDAAGDIFIGSYKGLYRYDHKQPNWSVYSELETETMPDKARKILPYAVLNDEDSGYVYIASESGFFYRFDKRTRRVEHSFYDRSFVDYVLFGYCLYMDDEGTIWIGSNRGLFFYDRRSGIVQHYNKDTSRIGQVSVRHIAGGKERGVLWLATGQGVFKIDKNKGVRQHLSSKSVPALSTNNVHFVEEDHRGNLWIGTNGGGINILAPDMNHIATLNQEQNGLANDIVYSIVWPDTNNAWISTFNGLSNYDLRTGSLVNYNVSDGLVSGEFNQGSFMKDRLGRLYFGSVNGVCYFHPDSIQMHVPDFTLFVSTSTVPGRKLTGNSDTILMYPSDFSFVIQFGISDYRAPSYNRFLYRIRGLTDEWQPIYGVPQLKIPELAPGHYTLEVKGINSYGRPAGNMLTFHLDSRQHFYKTWWFYLLLSLIFGGLLCLFFWIRIRSIRRMQQLRVQLASDLHDEVGGLLTRIVLFSDRLSEGDEPEAERRDTLEKIAELGRDATMSMNDILWAIDARNDFSGNLASRMREYTEQMLLPAHIVIRFDTSGTDHRHTIPTEVRQNLYLIFKEALNNIMKHSSATEVHIVYRHEGSHFYLSITNDGNTLKQVSKLTGQGVRNMQMRAKRIGAEIIYTSEGATYTLTVERKRPVR